MLPKIESTIFDSLLLFYVAMATNFLLPLYPKSHIKFINETPIIKYLLGFIVMLFSIYHLSQINNPTYVLIIAIILYGWFLLTTRLPPYYNVMFLTLLTIAFLFNMKINQIDLDNNMYMNTKSEQKKQYQTYITFIFIYIVVLTLIGYVYTIFKI